MDPVKDITDAYHEGDDVPTSVGAIRMDSGMLVPFLFVDYNRVAVDVHAIYNQAFAFVWEKLAQGMEVHFLEKNTIRASSMARFHVESVSDSEQHVLKAPVLYVDFFSDPASLQLFRTELDRLKLWIFHVRTRDRSYLMTFHWPDGRMVTRHEMKPLDVQFHPPEDLIRGT